MVAAGVLIHNGLALNTFPLITIDRLGVDSSFIRKDRMVVREFDSSKSTALAEVYLTIVIKPCQFGVPFIVVESSTMFNMLLVRP